MTDPRVIHGDMREVLGRMVAEGQVVQSIVTDPPYGLAFMGKAWDAADNVAFQPGTWRLCFDLLPPGGHLLAFAGTRTYHRMAVAIEEAGFEIRDTIAWLYGSGFPKSHNVAVAIDKVNGIAPRSKAFNMKGRGDRAEELDGNGREWLPSYEPATAAGRQWDGWGTALKPAMEMICVARKPLDGTVAATVLKHGTGALNIDGTRIQGEPTGERHNNVSLASGFVSEGSPLGRWPANVCHDGSDEVVSAFPDANHKTGGPSSRSIGGNGIYGGGDPVVPSGYEDSGSAARFFYSSKADADDRLGSKHPTVKPVDLMRWLVRLVTPPGGAVLDPFAGSGTTGMACMAEGIDCVLIEREAEYVADIKARIAHVRGDDTPLFAVAAE
jgi:site-specific DNA-methyltransferase (adenine-specific)